MIDKNGNYRLPDGCLFATKQEVEALNLDDRQALLADWREACREYVRA